MKFKENPLVTDLVNEKVLKTDPRERFLGAIDELQSNVMYSRSLIEDNELRNELEEIASKLSILMGEVAGGRTKIVEDDLVYLLSLIKKYEVNNGILSKFVLPGQNTVSASLHITRTVVRRAELEYAKVYEMGKGNDLVFEYLNKLSTFFYAIAVKYD